MTIYELHLAFKDAVDNLSSSSYPQFFVESVDRYLNLGAERFIKQRYGGSNVKREAFEETQKRTDDLSNLVTYVRLNPLNAGFFQTNSVQTTYYQLPADYWFALTERINGVALCGAFNREVYVYRHNELNEVLKNPFTRPKDDRIFRVISSGFNAVSPTNLVQVFYDTNTTVAQYELAYIAQFVKLRCNLGQGFNQPAIAGFPFTYQNTNPAAPNFWTTTQYWFNPQCHQEIVDLAAKAALETIEHPRYQTFQNEILTHE